MLRIGSVFVYPLVTIVYIYIYVYIILYILYLVGCVLLAWANVGGWREHVQEYGYVNMVTTPWFWFMIGKKN